MTAAITIVITVIIVVMTIFTAFHINIKNSFNFFKYHSQNDLYYDFEIIIMVTDGLYF